MRTVCTGFGTVSVSAQTADRGLVIAVTFHTIASLADFSVGGLASLVSPTWHMNY